MVGISWTWYLLLCADNEVLRSVPLYRLEVVGLLVVIEEFPDEAFEGIARGSEYQAGISK